MKFQKQQWLIVAFTAFLTQGVHADTSSLGDASCPRIDLNRKDFDGMPLCPDVVKDASAEAVFRCARDQTLESAWHPASQKEGRNMAALLNAFKSSREDGISSGTTSQILESADRLGLQVCRVKQSRTFEAQPEEDSFLIAYTQPGVRSYSGPFLMLRETKASKIMLIVPHDGSDGTNSATKVGFADSHALVEVSNGCRKGITNQSDFVDHATTLGNVAIRQLVDFFPKYVWIHLHGSGGQTTCSYRSRSAPLGRAFEASVKKATRVRHFRPFNAGYVTDATVRGDFYLKAEIPAVIWLRNRNSCSGILKGIETYPFAWISEE